MFYLKLLLENLLSNAVKYSRGKILISLGQYENKIFLTVEDNGSGIEEDFKKNIFKPFIRGAESKNGYGLGMALVKRIADLHNVEIKITTSEVLGGAKFSLLFV